MRRASRLLVLLLLTGCAPEVAPAPTTLAEAADQGEARFGVPASLTLAVGYTETRWQLPVADAHDDHGAPAPVGVGGLRSGLWIDGVALDEVAIATDMLGVAEAALASDAPLSLLGTAAALRALADARGVNPAADDPAAWMEVLGDYAGLNHDGAREDYALEVLRWISRGVTATGADGERTVLHSASVRVPDGVGAARWASGAEYGPARWVAASSTNYNSRSGTSIDRVIIHTTQGSYSGAISWFQNPSANVSAHYVIRSSDGQVTQMVHEASRAWHVGNWNSRSIGIEHEGFVADPGRWYTDAMYRSSALLTRHLCQKYGIPIDRTHIVGHVEAPGATHTDPGSGWDWPRYMALVRGEPERPDYDAAYSREDMPAEMTSGERAVAWVEMRNDGARTWSLDATRLGTAAPQDHASPLYDTENWINDHRATGPDHSDYATGRVGRFTFMITAPEVTETTTVTDTFRLVQEGVTWFGPRVPVSIVVHPRAPAAPTDGDGDGAAADVDCDDADPGVYPGANDLCGDGVDADCDGVDPECDPTPLGDAGPDLPEPDAGLPVPGTPPGTSRPDTLEGGCSVTPAGGSGRGVLGLVFALLALTLRRRRSVRR